MQQMHQEWQKSIDKTQTFCWSQICLLSSDTFTLQLCTAHCQALHCKLEGKYSLESTDPCESEIHAPPQPLPYLMPIPPNTLFYNKKFITAFLSLGLGNTS